MADISQRQQAWPTSSTRPLCSALETFYPLAIGCLDTPLALCSPEFCKDRWSRVTRATREFIQPSLLPSNMDIDCAGRRILDCDEDQKQETTRFGILRLHYILPLRHRTSRRESQKSSGSVDRRPHARGVGQAYNSIPVLLHQNNETKFHPIQAQEVAYTTTGFIQL